MFSSRYRVTSLQKHTKEIHSKTSEESEASDTSEASEVIEVKEDSDVEGKEGG